MSNPGEFQRAASAYQKAIRRWLPDARHVLDRFHVARVRHEALWIRVRVRDPCRWAVAAAC